MALTDTAVRNAKADGRTVRMFNERGLNLELSPNGGKWWRAEIPL
jgi:hypothetical protein